MSRLTIPCARDCICLPMCMNKVTHDLFDCCKLLSNHWYKYITSPKVHRKLSMKRALNFTTQMNGVLRPYFIPFIYHHQALSPIAEYKKRITDVIIFTDAEDIQHMTPKDLFYTLEEFEKIGINLLTDKHVGDIVVNALGAMNKLEEI